MTRQYSICRDGRGMSGIHWRVDDLSRWHITIYYIIVIYTYIACSFAAGSSRMIMHNILSHYYVIRPFDFWIFLETCRYPSCESFALAWTVYYVLVCSVIILLVPETAAPIPANLIRQMDYEILKKKSLELINIY